MAVQVNISDERMDNFSKEAQNTLKVQLEKYADEIIHEARLIEEGNREELASTEITSNYVLWAVRKGKMGRPKKKRTLIFFLLKSGAYIATFIAGLLFDFPAFQNSLGRLIWFLVTCFIAVVTSLGQFYLEGRE